MAALRAVLAAVVAVVVAPRRAEGHRAAAPLAELQPRPARGAAGAEADVDAKETTAPQSAPRPPSLLQRSAAGGGLPLHAARLIAKRGLQATAGVLAGSAALASSSSPSHGDGFGGVGPTRAEAQERQVLPPPTEALRSRPSNLWRHLVRSQKLRADEEDESPEDDVFYRKEFFPRSPEAWENALAETEIMYLLRGPRMIKLVDADYLEPPYEGIVLRMEYADGDVYHDILHRWDVSLETKVQLLADLLSALHHMEEKGFVHRDITPRNLFLFGDCSMPHECRLKVGNFESACSFTEGLWHPCEFAEPAGAWPFVAPETLAGRPGEGPARDMWSAGLVFYTMIFGHTPRTPSGALDSQVARNLSWLKHAMPGLAAVMERMLEEDPDERCTAGEALVAIWSWAAENGMELLAPEDMEKLQAEFAQRVEEDRDANMDLDVGSDDWIESVLKDAESAGYEAPGSEPDHATEPWDEKEWPMKDEEGRGVVNLRRYYPKLIGDARSVAEDGTPFVKLRHYGSSHEKPNRDDYSYSVLTDEEGEPVIKLRHYPKLKTPSKMAEPTKDDGQQHPRHVSEYAHKVLNGEDAHPEVIVRHYRKFRDLESSTELDKESEQAAAPAAAAADAAKAEASGDEAGPEGGPSPPKMFSMDEVAKHNTEKDCWIVVGDEVYDVTNYLEDHPHGVKSILHFAGKDATEEFERYHGGRKVIKEYGLDPGTVVSKGKLSK